MHIKNIVFIVISFALYSSTLSRECERLQNGKHATFSSTQKNDIEPELYNVICVGECSSDWNHQNPPFLVDCVYSDHSWKCYSGELPVSAAVSCIPCGDFFEKDNVIKNSCVVEVERWTMRGL
jgi:hypothetical protein